MSLEVLCSNKIGYSPVIYMAEWTRKVQKTGPNSLGITLPQPWTRHVKLKQKDSLKIEEKSGELVVKKADSDE